MSGRAPTAPARPPARVPGFRVLFLCLVCIGLGQSMLFAILPPAARALGLSPFRIATIFAASAFFWLFVSPWWGRQSDVWGRRTVILIGLLGFGLSMAMLATTIAVGSALPVVAVWPALVVSRCMFALVGSGVGPASQAYVADRTDAQGRTAGMALVSAAVGLGETLGPAVGAALASIALTAPIFFTAILSAVSAAVIWFFLPEEGPPRARDAPKPPRIGYADRRVLPFVVVVAALQAVRATTVITYALFLQDMLGLTAQESAQWAGVGFVTLAVAGLFAQIVVIQRFRPPARRMILAGVPFMLVAFVLLAVGRSTPVYLVALGALGLGVGLVRPGTAAGASLAVPAGEQGAVAGLLGGLSVVGNLVGPLLGTSLYEITPRAPYLLNLAVMTALLGWVFLHPRVRGLRA